MRTPTSDNPRAVITYPFGNWTALSCYARLYGGANLLKPQLTRLGDEKTMFKERPRRERETLVIISEFPQLPHKLPELLQAGGVAKLGVERSVVCRG